MRRDCSGLKRHEQNYTSVRSRRSEIFFGLALHENDHQRERELKYLDEEELKIVGGIMDHQAHCPNCSA